MKCCNCSREIPENSLYCNWCGKKQLREKEKKLKIPAPRQLPSGSWTVQLVAFVLFRFFDAAKPGPIGWADRRFHGASGWKGGWGILLDDLVAAFCTLLVIAVWRAW